MLVSLSCNRMFCKKTQNKYFLGGGGVLCMMFFRPIYTDPVFQLFSYSAVLVTLNSFVSLFMSWLYNI